MKARWLVSLLFASGCIDGLGSESQAVSNGNHDNGTRLRVDIDDAAVTCGEGGAVGDFAFTVTSTASADSAILTASVDGNEQVIGEIPSGAAGWTFDGPTKTATASTTLPLGEGTHTIVICATQSGAHGRNPKHACSAPMTIEVDCEEGGGEGKGGCNQGIGNGPEGCDPGNSNHHNPSNDEMGSPGRGRGHGHGMGGNH